MPVRRSLVTGDLVCTLGDEGTLRDGAVVVEGETVVAVGRRPDLEQMGPFDVRLGGEGCTVLPGFVNSHYHSECWTGPGLIGTIFELSNLYLGAGPTEVDERALELLSTWGLVQAIRGGQTTTVDVYYGKPGMELHGCEPVLRAYERTGMRTAFALSLRDQNRYVHQPDEVFLSRLPEAIAGEVRRSPLGYAWPVDGVLETYSALVERWDGRHGRVRIMLAPDWTPACSDQLFRRCRQLATEHGTGITTHVLETRSEMMWNLETHGMTAVQRLAELGVLGDDVTFSHFVWATDADIALVADAGVNIASNPGSNLRLSSGICRVRDLLAAGARVGIGTDGISFSDREDYFEELRLAAYLQRQPDVFSEHRLDSEALLRSAATTGARAARFEGRIGVLQAGALADLLVVGTGDLFFPPGRYEGVPPLDVVLDRASARDLQAVMINGAVVLEAGACTTVDEDRLRQEILELAEHLYRRDDRSARWLELANELVPHAQPLYDRWYGSPIDEPASVFNTRRVPGRP